MLASRALRLRPPFHHAIYSPARVPSSRRTFIQNLNDGFLDLALALPYPSHWPAYSATIILLTVAVRASLIPTIAWSKRRQLRYQKHVIPVLAELKPIVMHEEALAMKKEGLLEDKEHRAEIHARRLRDKMKAKSRELAKIHSCNPTVTALIPVVPQLPVFIVMTIMFARLAADPTSPFDSESFLTLTTLNHPDPSFTLPVVLGLMTMANVESSHWVLNPAEREELKESEKKLAAAAERSQNKWTKLKLKLRTGMKDGMRILAIVRIGIASVAPGAVTLYWLTSATFGVLQTWVVNYLEAKARRELRASPPPSMTREALHALAKTSPAKLAMKSATPPSPPRSGSSSALSRLQAAGATPASEQRSRKDKKSAKGRK